MAFESENGEVGPLDRQNVVALDRPAPSPARQILLEIIQTISLAILLFVAINFVSARIRVDGQSMQPTFQEGDYVVVNRLAYRFGEIDRGDVVVFPYPLDPQRDLIKRVIGLPGDRVWIANGIVYVNGTPLQEPYLAETPSGDLQERVIPEGFVFLLGDNRNDSSDSRSWGPLPVGQIIGRAVFRYWPIDALGVVEHPDLTAAAP